MGERSKARDALAMWAMQSKKSLSLSGWVKSDYGLHFARERRNYFCGGCAMAKDMFLWAPCAMLVVIHIILGANIGTIGQ